MKWNEKNVGLAVLAMLACFAGLWLLSGPTSAPVADNNQQSAQPTTPPDSPLEVASCAPICVRTFGRVTGELKWTADFENQKQNGRSELCREEHALYNSCVPLGVHSFAVTGEGLMKTDGSINVVVGDSNHVNRAALILKKREIGAVRFAMSSFIFGGNNRYGMLNLDAVLCVEGEKSCKDMPAKRRAKFSLQPEAACDGLLQVEGLMVTVNEAAYQKRFARTSQHISCSLIPLEQTPGGQIRHDPYFVRVIPGDVTVAN